MFRETVINIAQWNRWFEKYPELIFHGTTGDDVRRAKAQGRTAIFFGLQNPSPIEDDIVLPKTSSSVFVSTHIDYILRNLGVKQIIVSGLITDQCVESAIRDACDLGYLVTKVSDACLTYSNDRHSNSLQAIKGYCRQLTSEELIEELSNA